MQFFHGLQDSEHPLDMVKDSPYNAETPEKACVFGITPSSNAYIRSNFEVPLLSKEHSIEVGGAVLKPLKLSIKDLQNMPQRTLTATMECAGNDRLTMRPLPDGEPWKGGAVATLTWTGVPLVKVLEMAGVSAEAIEVLTTGADSGLREDAQGEVRYARALPLKHALHEDVLLAWSMNGELLNSAHGAPLRLIVPGWYGMASVKWVTRIDLLTTPFAGYFHKQRYVYEDKNGTSPVERMRVKSIITHPLNDAILSEKIEITGFAWSGDGPITRVEVKVDGGNVWHEARLGQSGSPYAWTPWSFTIPVKYAGRLVFSTRATDASGATQPDEIIWNQHGYGNNAIRYVAINVKEKKI